MACVSRSAEVLEMRNVFAELGHVLEFSGFPSDWKPDDIQQVLMQLRCRQCSTVWVDDTHVLVVFSGKMSGELSVCLLSRVRREEGRLVVAKEALATGHPCVQLKPLSQAAAASKRKAATSIGQNIRLFLR